MMADRFVVEGKKSLPGAEHVPRKKRKANERAKV